MYTILRDCLILWKKFICFMSQMHSIIRYQEESINRVVFNFVEEDLLELFMLMTSAHVKCVKRARTSITSQSMSEH